MTTFSDDFNRADGLLGNGWTTPNNRATIVGQEVHFSTLGYGSRTVADANAFVRVRALVKTLSGGSSYGGVVAKLDQAANQCYELHYAFTTVASSCSIIKWNNLSQTQLVSASWSPRDTGPHTVELTWQAGLLTGYVDGTQRVQVTDTSYDDHISYGLRGSGTSSVVDDFYFDDIAATPTLAIAPDPLEELGPDPAITLTGTDTAWDPDTNTPTFTVDKGSITDQVIDSPTTAHANYHLPVVEDTATFTDPSTGATDVVALSSTLNVEAVGTIDDVLAILGTPAEGHTVTGDQSTTLGQLHLSDTPPSVQDIIDWFVAGFLEATVPEALLDKLDALYGKLPADQQLLSLETLAQTELAWLNRNLGLLTDDVASIAGEEELSLRAVINAICGVPNITVSEVKDLIDALTLNGYWDLAGIKVQIDLARGADLRDLTQLYDLVYSLGMPDLAQIMAELNWITGTRTTNLPNILTAVNNAISRINDTHDHEQADYSDLSGGGVNSLQTVLNAIAALDAALDSGVTNIRNDIADLKSWLTPELTWIKAELATIDARTGDIHTDLDAVHTQVDSLQNTDLTHVNAELDTIRAKLDELLAGEGVHVPPVWPGLANVTLAAPTVCTDNTIINAVCHGVVVTVDGVDNNTSRWVVDSRTNYKYAGYVAFISDRGDVEGHQYLGQGAAIYTPQTMASASAILVYLMHATQVTVRPWTINP